MNYKVQIKEQVKAFQATLGFMYRREIKQAIARLANEHGDIQALGDNLTGYYRLKVGRYRVIFRYLPGRVIDCVYLDERKLVYEMFESEMGRIIGAE